MPGPLSGLKVIEMVGLGPAPFCAMMLADQGAEVIRIDRPGKAPTPGDTGSARFDVTARGRRSLALDMRKPGAVAAVLKLVAQADVLIEGFRPGVMERMGLGPEVCLAQRPQLVYGRMTGWGQAGPLAQAAGHDINYIALTGTLNAIGRHGQPPVPPLNLVGDFGGGAMMLAFGVMCALTHARSTGQGQVVDAAMTDGAALLAAMMYGFKGAGRWSNQREHNLLDGGAPFYGCYECADGKHVAIGALEPQFHAELLQRCGLDPAQFEDRMNPKRWPALKARMAEVMRSKTRDEWCALLEGSDACFAPVLDWEEAPAHPHNRARGSFVEVAGVVQPAPAPRFSATPAALPTEPQPSGAQGAQILRDWGLAETEVQALRDSGALQGSTS